MATEPTHEGPASHVRSTQCSVSRRYSMEDSLAGISRASPPAKAAQLGPDGLALLPKVHAWSGANLGVCLRS